MNAMTPFAFEDHLVRIVTRDDEPWFVLADICRALDLKEHRGSYAAHADKLDADEKFLADRSSILRATPGLNTGVFGEWCNKQGWATVDAKDPLTADKAAWIVSESGCYALILRCRGATTEGTVAHRFRRWVTHEVLPAIRRTGRYAVEDAAPAIDPNEVTERAMRLALDQVREARQTFGTAAARAVWKSSGLPWMPGMDAAPPPPTPVEEIDAVARFAREGIERTPGVYTAASVFWAAFVEFCAAADLPCPSRGAFQTRFGRMGFAKRMINSRSVYSGIRPRVVAANSGDE